MGRKGYPLKYVVEVSCYTNKLCGDFDAESESVVRISDQRLTSLVKMLRIESKSKMRRRRAFVSKLHCKIENYK